MVRTLVSVAAIGCFVALSAAACGSGRDTFDPDAVDAGGTSSSGGNSRTPPPSGPIGSSGSSGGAEEDAGLGSCAAQSVAGKQLPLDIHIMLDASGSMMGKTGVDGNGPTKWSEVKGALGGFINDPKSAGIGVGLGIFPIKNANAPAKCTSNADCTVNGVNLGRCGLKVCSPPLNSSAPIRSCDTSADCPNNAACREQGQCRTGILVLTDRVCLKDDPNYGCPNFPFNYKCEAFTESTCWEEQCVLGDYDDARVPIGALPGNAVPLTNAITAIPDPPENALTPTAGALEGGLIYAKNHKTQNPDHVVVMVLATDGFPTRCNTMDIPGVAAIAAASANGNPSIKTYVIGVFSDQEKAAAKTNLDAIAAGGGTSSAFIVTTGSNVTQQFQQALEAIRGEALPCEYLVPTPEAGTPDYDKVNVQFTSGGQSTLIGYKKKADDCDVTGGWYYDADPANGGVPTKISLCPTSCNAVKSGGAGAKIDVLLGCKTVVK